MITLEIISTRSISARRVSNLNVYLIIYLFLYISIVAINYIIDKWTVGVKEKRHKFL